MDSNSIASATYGGRALQAAEGNESPRLRFLLWFSILGGLIGTWIIRFADHSSLAVGTSLAVVPRCAIPWLVLWRRRFWRVRFAVSLRWSRLVEAMLWLALLTFPMVTGLFFVSEWLSGSGPFSFLRLLIVGQFAFLAACGAGSIAIFIQLWRDRWFPILTLATVSSLLLIYMAFCWVISDGQLF